MTIKTLLIKFQNKISASEIPLFRGAVINSLDEKLVLFHNHVNDKLRYAYPLIQYKRIDGRAAIMCIGEGADTVWEFFQSANFNIHLGERRIKLQLGDLLHQDYNIAVDDKRYYAYSITEWLPLNQDNYEQYIHLDDLGRQVAMLNRILTGNILSMCKGLGIYLDQKVETVITSLSPSKEVRFKNVPVISFDVTFHTNTYLPDNIGIGKHVSVGFGTIKNQNEKQL